MRPHPSLLLCGMALGMAAGAAGEADRPWPASKVWQWYARLGPVKGCNYLPRTAVNATEMYQADTFDPETIDQELGWAQRGGYNAPRVFLQYIVWRDDPEGLKRRLDRSLTLADRRGIKTMPVLFCDCSFSGREPYPGRQGEPVPGVHNSGWVPSPGLGRVADRSAWPGLERYVKDIVGSFAKDRRVMAWDLYNEPGNSGMGEKSLPLAETAFRWARAESPSLPLAVGVWENFASPMSKRLPALSDVASFHGYGAPEGARAKARLCGQEGRPVLCTEWLHRQGGNTVAAVLPVFAESEVGWFHWGLVAGKTQTYMPWGSKMGDPPSAAWQHDTFRPDGTPCEPSEISLIPSWKPSRRTSMTDNRPTSALWYRQPAADPFEALPFGNGRLGGMIYGGQEEEYLQLNEISLWTGGPQDADNPDALKYLPQIRQLLQEGKYVEAQSLTYEKLVCKGEGTHGGASADYPYGAYQPLADLKLAFKPLTGEITDYRRDLDLETATAHVRFASGGARFEREVFSSAPDQVIALRLASDRPGQISFTARLSREADAAVSASGPDELLLKGRAWGGKGMRFAARLRIRAERGKLFAEGNSLRVEGADAVTLLLTGATDYTGIDPEQATKEQLQAAARKSYPSLRKRHTADYRRLYSRVSLNLGAPASEEPTDARFRAVQEGSSDPDLMALYFQYGRYLLISSSRPGSLPANLQGLWSWKMQPEWNADYHTNINVQMNYWPAEVANLAECHLPLFAFIDSLREPGRKTAKAHYGAGGWVAHTVTNIWGYTSPGEHPSWGQFPAAGAWLCQHLWEHYAFGGDKKFLEYAYPIMKGSAQFFLDFLVEEQKRGWLVTAPSNSPENSFRTPDGQVASVCMGPSMDEQILWDLFSHCIEASRALDTDAGFRARLEKARARLAPPQIGKHGQLMEWMEDWDEPEPGHRHISQAFAFHPGNQITLRGTPELAAAFRRTLERRLSYGGGQTGWSRAWVVSLWARFEEGDLALDSLINLFRTNTEANFFDLHPPHIFQIDGNFGAAAGIAEILLQSHAGEIALLPALPKAWPAGSVRGLRARGGAEVSLRWQDGLAASAEIKVTRSHTLRLRPPKGQRIATVAGPEGKIAFQGKDGVAEFEGKAGEVYRLRMQ